MTEVTRTSNAIVAELRKHAEAWHVTADTPDEDVLNETAMARECARAANEIERLHRELEHMADMQLAAAVNRPVHEPCVPQTAIALLADDAYAATFQTMAQYRAALISSLRTAQLEPYCWAIELDGICTDRLYSEHRDARLIASDYRTDGRTAEVVALVNLDDVRSASATPPACEPRTQLPDEREMRLAQPPASEPPADYIAPIACIRVGEDDTCEVLKLYAPGLPPGEHDLYPAASAPPPGLVQALIDAAIQWRKGPPNYYATNQALRDAVDAYSGSTKPDEQS